MRALLWSGMGRQVEACASIKKTLFKNMTNFTCWHVQGILLRKDKDYDGARRAYLQALKLNAENDSVLRDLCQMQIHLRDYAGFHETRRQVLVKNSGNRENWTSFALGCYLNCQYDQCINAIDSMIKVNLSEEKNPLTPPQLMEILTLKVKSLMAKEQFNDALKLLTDNSKSFVDSLQRHQLFVDCYTKLGNKEKA